MKIQWFFLMLVLSMWACSTEKDSSDKDSESTETDSLAQVIIDRTITTHGSKTLRMAEVQFSFRGTDYLAVRDGYDYYYQRQFVDSAGQRITDQVWPDSMIRSVDGETVDLPEDKAHAYAETVHSVIYFAFLPEALNDPAVIKEYYDSTEVMGEPYHKIRVTFKEESGGDDFKDEYMYWIHRDEHSIDYLAYNFQVNDGGARFRAAENVREIDGIRFQDYKNYVPKDDRMEIAVLDSLYEEEELKFLSDIQLDSIEVAVKGR